MPKKSSKREKIEGVYAKTQNVVVSASIHRDLPLEKLATKLDGAEYNPEQFPGLIYKSEIPKFSALLFSSGKIICTGTKSMKAAKEATKVATKSLKEGNLTNSPSLKKQRKNKQPKKNGRVVITLSKEEIKVYVDMLKNIFVNHPGLILQKIH